MKKLISIGYTTAAFNISMFILRVGGGVLVLGHGYSKLIQFAEMKSKFINFMGIGSSLSLSLVIFAELFCAIFLIIGLFSRLMTIPLIIELSIALVKAHGGDAFGAGEKAALYLLIFITILFCGPGRASVDGMIR